MAVLPAHLVARGLLLEHFLDSLPEEKVEAFGDDTPLGRPGQPAELAGAYVLLASDDGSYMSGARVAVTGGRPIL